MITLKPPQETGTTTAESMDAAPNDRLAWNTARPQTLLKPTYWPAVMAMGITMILWGIITTVIITAVGLVLFILAAIGWIKDLLGQEE